MSRRTTTRRNAITTTDHPQEAPRERWQHGADRHDELLAGASVQRVDDAVDSLIRGGHLHLSARGAADRWLADYEFGVHGAKDPEKVGRGCISYDSLVIARLQAQSDYVAAKAAIGREADLLLVRVLHERLSLRTIAGAGAGGCARDRVSGRLIAVMERLSEHYEQTDDARRRHRRAAANDAAKAAA